MKTIQKKIFLFVVVLFVAFPFSTIAQTAVLTFERDQILIGEQIKMHLTMQVPPGTKGFTFPDFGGDTITKHIEFIGTSNKTDTLQSGKILELQREYIITSFDSGRHTIPPLSFSYIFNEGDDPVVFMSDSAFLNVLLVDVDTAQTIMDIKGPWKIPFQWREYVWVLIAALALLLIAGVILYFYMRRKKGLPFFPKKTIPPLPPHTEALLALDRIKKEKIWRTGMVKDYYTHLTDTLRNYIERRFHIPAPELTSSETIEALLSMEIDHTVCTELKHILQTADMVKFAKSNPISTENENCLDKAYVFVHVTKKEEEEPGNEEHETDSKTIDKKDEI